MRKGALLRFAQPRPELEAQPLIRESGGRQELLIQLNVEDQAPLKQRYEWNL